MLICEFCGKEPKPGNDIIWLGKKREYHIKKCCPLGIFGIEEYESFEEYNEKKREKRELRTSS